MLRRDITQIYNEVGERVSKSLSEVYDNDKGSIVDLLYELYSNVISEVECVRESKGVELRTVHKLSFIATILSDSADSVVYRIDAVIKVLDGVTREVLELSSYPINSLDTLVTHKDFDIFFTDPSSN